MNNKETVEEAANKANGYNLYAKGTKGQTFNEGFIEGAKWQEKRMYSEDDLRYAFECATDLDPSFDTFRAWFEQFKKKV